MRTPEELKLLLQRINENGYEAPDGRELDGITEDMLRYIGHTDPELRDKLIYSTFYRWTVSGAITPERMKGLLEAALDDEHLFYRIGERDTDSVFTRSFSMLVVALAVYAHREKAFLTEDGVDRVMTAVLRYCAEERDRQGYVEGRGWAHAVAHAADALEELAQLEAVSRESLWDMLRVMKAMISSREQVYICEEEERVAIAVMAVYRRGVIPKDDFRAWLSGFDTAYVPGGRIEDDNQRINCRNFLKSLYFSLLREDGTEGLRGVIVDKLNA